MVSLSGITGNRPHRSVVWRRAWRGRVAHARTVDAATGGLSAAAVCGFVPAVSVGGYGGWSSMLGRGQCGDCTQLLEREHVG